MNVECTGQCFRSSSLLSYNVPIPLLHCIFEIIYTDYTPRLHLGQCLCQVIETSCESFREKTRLRDSRESQTKTPCQSTCIKASFLFESHDMESGSTILSADMTVRMYRLICAFVISKCNMQVFS